MNRTWHKGPPPHIGWWEASVMRQPQVWRWWDGAQWSIAVDSNATGNMAARAASSKTALKVNDVEWTDYWPENARVPRIDPRGTR